MAGFLTHNEATLVENSSLPTDDPTGNMLIPQVGGMDVPQSKEQYKVNPKSFDTSLSTSGIDYHFTSIGNYSHTNDDAPQSSADALRSPTFNNSLEQDYGNYDFSTESNLICPGKRCSNFIAHGYDFCSKACAISMGALPTPESWTPHICNADGCTWPACYGLDYCSRTCATKDNPNSIDETKANGQEPKDHWFLLLLLSGLMFKEKLNDGPAR